jgi:hypothetical protein
MFAQGGSHHHYTIPAQWSARRQAVHNTMVLDSSVHRTISSRDVVGRRAEYTITAINRVNAVNMLRGSASSERISNASLAASPPPFQIECMDINLRCSFQN